MPKHLFSMCCVLVLLGAAAAEAQDKGQVGLTMAYPASVGLIWHVTDRVAIRPDFSVTRQSSEAASASFGPGLGPSSASTTSENWNAAVGLSALLYMRTWDRVRVYISPRFTFTRARSDATSGISNDLGLSSTSRVYGGSGSFGAQAAVATRLAVFGEVGFAYTRSRTDTDGRVSLNEISTQSAGTRAGVGIAFYF